jgi:hypothetical protein
MYFVPGLLGAAVHVFMYGSSFFTAASTLAEAPDYLDQAH